MSRVTPRSTSRRVFLHIGEPKTGTTFIQQVIWRNRAELAAQGIMLPGHHAQDHFRAVQDLRQVEKLSSDPASSWVGEWDILAAQASASSACAVISHELLAAVTPDQALRAKRTLGGTELHIVVTVRDIASLLPAEWQETVKHRNTRAWMDWLFDVIDNESISENRREWWFWRVHDTLAILDMWAADVPSDRVHVITMPPSGAPPAALWDRFASVLGVDPRTVDISRARGNASLGGPETELLRRVNQAIPEDVPDWFYMWNVKEPLAHGTLAARPKAGGLVLPSDRVEWARAYADQVITGIRARGHDVSGDLIDLLAHPAAFASVYADDVPPEQMLDAAVAVIADLVQRQYRTMQSRQHPLTERRAGMVDRAILAVHSTPRLKRTVRRLSSRHQSVARARVMAWRLLERSRSRARQR